MNTNIEKLVKTLIRKNLSIATMESCTGGGLANEITNVAGASEVFKFGATTYSNEFKIKMGVAKDVIDEYSVYSAQTAQEMSLNISNFTGADFGVGITGKLKRFDPQNNAGENDVVFVCVYNRNEQKFYHQTVKVSHESREENKQEVINVVAELVLTVLDEN